MLQRNKQHTPARRAVIKGCKPQSRTCWSVAGFCAAALSVAVQQTPSKDDDRPETLLDVDVPLRDRDDGDVFPGHAADRRRRRPLLRAGSSSTSLSPGRTLLVGVHPVSYAVTGNQLRSTDRKRLNSSEPPTKIGQYEYKEGSSS